MVKLIKAGIILALLALIGGGGYGAFYFLVVKPKQVDAADLVASGPAGQPTPDPTTPEFDHAKALKRDGKTAEATQALSEFLARYPDSTHRDEAEDMLGDLNISSLFSGLPGPHKTEYLVERGDVLDRVAHKAHSTPELIFQANNLERIMLQIGQKLEIPDVNFAMQVDLEPKKILLLDHGLFFKAYTILDARPLAKKSGDIHTKIFEKVAIVDSRRVTFGAKEYPGSARSLTLVGQPGFTIYGQSAAGQGHAPGSGLELTDADATELHTLVSVGTPVTISAK